MSASSTDERQDGALACAVVLSNGGELATCPALGTCTLSWSGAGMCTMQAEAAAEHGAEDKRGEAVHKQQEQQQQQPCGLPSSCPKPSCHADTSAGISSRRLFGIVGDGQSHWQPLVRESNEVMELAGLNTDWLLHDLLVFADAVYA